MYSNFTVYYYFWSVEWLSVATARPRIRRTCLCTTNASISATPLLSSIVTYSSVLHKEGGGVGLAYMHIIVLQGQRTCDRLNYKDG